MEPPPQPPASLEGQIRRVERVAGFAAEQAHALKAEFAPLWASRPAPGSRPAAFMGRVERSLAVAERCMQQVARARTLPPADAAKLLAGLGLDEVLETGRGLEAEARALREHLKTGGAAPPDAPPPEAPAADAPTAGAPAAPAKPGPDPGKPRGLVGMLHGWLDKLEVPETRVPPRPRPGVPPGPGLPGQQAPGQAPGRPGTGGLAAPPPSRSDMRLKALDATLALVSDVLDDVAPPLVAVRAALAGAPTPEEEASMSPGHRAALPALIDLFRADAEAARAARVAVGQWTAAARAHGDLANARAAAAKLAGPAREQALAACDPLRLKGQVMPLTNLAMAFKGWPALAALFPPPASRRLVASVPTETSATRPIKPPGRAGASPLVPTERPEEDVSEPAEAPPPAAGPPAEAPAPAPAPAPAAAAEDANLSPAELSQRRLRLIAGYIKDPAANEKLKDRKLLYRLVSEERAYQQDMASHNGMQLRLLPEKTLGEPDTLTARREALTLATETAKKRAAQFLVLLKQITAAEQAAHKA